MTQQHTCSVCGHQQAASAPYCAQCGNPMPGLGTGQLPPHHILQQGRYLVLHTIGRGGMGAVYQAADQRLGGKSVAIKEMSDAAITNPQDKLQAIAAFRQEAQLLAQLDHPNIPKVTDFFTENNKHYIVMEFVQGQTLEHLLQQRGQALSEAQLRPWLDQLFDVLAYLHRQNPPIIFRDLKPANIMLTPQGRIKLIDFGIARFFKGGQSRDTLVMGTPGFAAPEQYGHGQTDARSDIYSLGVVIHHLLTGYDPTTTPFSLPPARQLNGAISLQMEQAVGTATQTSKEKRFQTIDEMRQATTESLGPPPVTPPPRSTSRWLALGAGAVALLAIGLILVRALIGQDGGTTIPTQTPTPSAATATPTNASVVGVLTETPVSVPTDTPTARPAPTDTATRGPTNTPRPTATATRRPTDTPRPTNTPLPQPTPTPVVVVATVPVVPVCSIPTDGQLNAVVDSGRMGCPTGPAQLVWAAWQPFQGGNMLWRSDTSRLSVFYNNNTWLEQADQWDQVSPVPSRGNPPAGLQAPVRGFGYLWGTRDDIFNGLGWALSDEKGFCAYLQPFERGIAFRSSSVETCGGNYNRANDAGFPYIYIGARGDGTWRSG